ncbi:glycolipid 2-alpha-mannosyltransferase, partial [Hamiltosporidium magnivora]
MFLLLYFILQILTKENAVIVILCRNEEMNQISESIKNFEEIFNKQYNYPYVFLNDNDFTEEFKSKIKSVVSSTVEFGKINYPMWGPPKHINMDKAKENMKSLESQNIIYGGSLSYRNMCRFFSGYFYRHDLVKKYDYYWRIEPGVKFFCKMNYDPFKFLRESKKEYGFVITIREYMQTIPTLWD